VNDKTRALLISEIPHLRRYARSLTREKESADDLVQSCLERAIDRFSLWRRDKTLRPWLFAIMHNLHVSTIRHRERRPVTVSMDQVESRAESSGASPESWASVGELMDAIDLLPEDQRSAILLVGLENLSYVEAAQVLAIPVGTLMSRLHRGRQRLREAMDMAPPSTSPRSVPRLVK
jgi:RNA polymerase sigma-70 factor (ECF subfamily)